MSHGIEANDHVYLGSNTPAWHKLFDPIPGNATEDEALDVMKLRWGPLKLKTRYTLPNGRDVETGGNAVVRDDDFTLLARDVSDGYVFHTHPDLISLLKAACDAEGFVFETGGSTEGGKRVWVQAKTMEKMYLAGDVHYPFVMTTTRHDATGSTICKEGATRAVCNNTIGMFLGESTPEIRIPHNGNSKVRIEEARGALRKVRDRHLIMAKQADLLQAKKLSKVEEGKLVEEWVKLAYPDPPKKYNDVQALQDAIERTNQRRVIATRSIRINTIQELQNAGDAVLNSWLLWNAIGEFADTDYLAMGTRGGTESRFTSIMGGKVQVLKEKAQVMLLAA